MKQWGFAIISMGCIFICLAPTAPLPAPMIIMGMILAGLGVFLTIRGNSKKKEE